MIVKHLFRLVFLICFYGCLGNSDNHVNRPKEKQLRLNQYHHLQFGLNIENGPRQGMQYFSSGAEYNYRYNTITIWNDSTVAIQLEIGFSEMVMNLKDSIRSKIFLLPRHLTPNEQHFDTGGISEELKKFLDFEIDNPVHLSKVLNPGEKCVLTFGVLTDTKYPDPTTPYETELLTSREKTSAISLKLKINDTLIIPCGQILCMQK
jgi:hypothetical protein